MSLDLIDVAILRLSEDAPIGKEVYPAKLPMDDSDLFIGRSVQIGGWGISNYMLYGLPTFTEATVVRNSECQKIWRDFIDKKVISNELLCTHVFNGTGSQRGDSGGK